MISRRSVLTAPLALGACAAAPPNPTPLPPLKSIAPCPVGVCAMTGHFDEPAWVDVATRHFNQITPEWEMKMEAILKPDRSYDFTRPDRIAAFADNHGLRLHGHALVWYSQGAEAFAGLDRARFAAEYDRYISTVAERYRNKVVSWDVVNEAVAEDGNGLRDCHWSQALGQDGYIIRAFEQARAADPEAVLFLNDYNLENNPVKGATFLRLVERLLKAGAPIGGIGTQSHLDIETPAGRITAFMRDAAAFGLPIHVSELDASLVKEGGVDLRSARQKRDQQTARVAELTEAFMALPARQRFAFTVWGLRDSDSWLTRDARAGSGDSPLLFDATGKPNPMAATVAAAFQAA